MQQPVVIPFERDIINRFLSMTAGDDTPDLYRKWSAISLVAGALERRVWTRSGSRGGNIRQTFPNLYVFLVGAPGVGKNIIDDIRDLWRNTLEPGTSKPAFHVAYNNMTKASMLDSLAESTRSFLPPTGAPYEYHSLLIAAEEFGVFLPSYDISFIAMLNELYNAPAIYAESRRHGPARDISVELPILNILGGVQPVWMNSVFPQEAWGMGLLSRVIMIYATSGEPADPFAEGTYRPTDRARLIESLRRLSQLYGEVPWEQEAQERVRDWHMKGGPPAPTHSKLEHYCRRRTLHVIKLSIISSISRLGLVGSISTEDVERAIGWLIEAEQLMPDIFRSMVGQSDHEIIEELYHHLVNLYSMSKRAPIAERFLVMFLVQRVPSDKISKILEMAERANMLARIAGTDTYIPKNRNEFAE